MLTVTACLLTLAATLLAVPSLVLALECFLARAPASRGAARGDVQRYVVVVPAHDEEAGIARTLDTLRSEVDEKGTILVVADNCSDGTAEIARTFGARVLERTDPAHRGKGHALAHAVRSLAAEPPEVLVFVDADCIVEPGAVTELVAACTAYDAPVQADYVLQAHDPSPREALSTLAFLVRNRVRPLGLARIGGPCGLFGTGMAMPYSLFVSLPNAEGHLVEDMWLGIECTLRGRAPRFVPTARVTSAAAPTDAATRNQRVRWEHGHLGVMRRDLPRLFADRRRDSWLLGLDLAVPPLALLVLLTLGVATLSFVAFLLGASIVPLAIALASLFLVTTGVLVAWSRFGRTTLPARNLLAIPGYVLWKIPVYLGLMRHRETSWNRTERTADDP